MDLAKPTATTPRHWELFSHIADMGVRGFGDSLEEAFAHAALALTAIVCEPARVSSEQSVKIRCEAPDPELLLVDWLNALIYEMALKNMLFSRFDVHIEGGRLVAEAYGETLDRTRHQPAVEVKGATFTALAVRQAPDGQWIAQCVVDV